MKLQDGRVVWVETIKVLKRLLCIHQVSLPLHFPPLMHAVRSQLETQKTKEIFQVDKPRTMRRGPLDRLASDILNPIIIGKDYGGNGHEHELEHA